MGFIPFISFLIGILSVISPCIIPVLPILLGFTLKNRTKKDIFLFILGLFLIFTILIFLTAFFTVIFYTYILYIRIISAIIISGIGILFIFNKTFNIYFKMNSKTNSFILGVLTSLSWSPCYGGYLISLISALLTTGNMMYNTINIISYTLGFAFILFILSLFIFKINIERLSKNSLFIRRISGILFIFSAIYMILNVMGVF